MQNETEYRGMRIVMVEHTSKNPLKDDSFGFTMPVAFRVLDELDGPALPSLQQLFWSPNDARNAIEMFEHIAADIRTSTWPTTKQYEYNTSLLYYRNFDLVYHALQRIKKACRDARDFDENPRQKVEDILSLLHQNMYQREPREAGRYGKPMKGAPPPSTAAADGVDDGF